MVLLIQSLCVDDPMAFGVLCMRLVLYFFAGYERAECLTITPVKNGHSKIDITKVLTTNGRLMKVKSIAECILQYL